MSFRTIKNFILSAVRVSDKKRWSQLDNHDVEWGGRTETMSRYVKPGESVFELGAGRCHLREFLPKECAYTPSDIVERIPGTFVFDFNRKPIPALPSHDVLFASGVLEYAHDLPDLIKAISGVFGKLIVSYADTDRFASAKKRMRNGWFCNLARNKFLGCFTAAGYELVAEEEWNKHGIYVLEKKS